MSFCVNMPKARTLAEGLFIKQLERGEQDGQGKSAMGSIPLPDAFLTAGQQRRTRANHWKRWDAKPEAKAHFCATLVRLQ